MQNRVADYPPGAASRSGSLVVPEGGPALPSRIAWGAIIAGAVVAVAVGLTLNILGAAIGASVVDATTGDTPSAQSFGIAGGIWLMVSNLIGLAFGGYVAARLSGTADETDSVLHGLSVWAVGFLIAAVLSGNIIGGTASTAVQGAGQAIGGLAQGAGQAVQAAAEPLARQVDPRQLVDRARSALAGSGGDPAAMNSEQRTAEIGRILTERLTERRDFTREERDRVNALVAAEYNIPPEEAQRRLQQAETQATEALRRAEQRAREAADAAATGAAVAAYWAFAALLLGAVAAVLGARFGTRNRVLLSSRSAAEAGVTA